MSSLEYDSKVLNFAVSNWSSFSLSVHTCVQVHVCVPIPCNVHFTLCPDVCFRGDQSIDST